MTGQGIIGVGFCVAWDSAPPRSRPGLCSPRAAEAAQGFPGTRAVAGPSGGASGAKPSLNVWYHQYGEAGTQQAVTRYAKQYPDASVKVQWTPGDYTSKLNAGLLSSG